MFNGNSTGGKLKKWSWYMNSNDIYSKNENVSYFFRENGNYPVVLVVENQQGCRDTMIKYIKIESDFSIYVPNAFTPNGDGLNDVFLPVTRGVKKYSLELFNRWGERIFFSREPMIGWDG